MLISKESGGGVKFIHRTSEHHHVLEVALDLVPPAEVEEEGQRVNIQSSSKKYGDLTGGRSGSLRPNKSKLDKSSQSTG